MKNQEFTYNRFECILSNEGQIIEKKHGVNTPKTVRITEKEAAFMNSQIQDTWILFEKVEEESENETGMSRAEVIEKLTAAGISFAKNAKTEKLIELLPTE
jgi:hypothetical protein